MPFSASFRARGARASLARPQRLEIALDPVRPDLRFAPLNIEGIGLHVARDDAAGGNEGPLADLDRSHQRSIGPDEGARPDLCQILIDAIVVAADCAGAAIGSRPDAGIADIGQMVDLGARLDHGLLDLDEIADMDIARQGCAGAKPGKRADDRSLADAGALDMGKAP